MLRQFGRNKSVLVLFAGVIAISVTYYFKIRPLSNNETSYMASSRALILKSRQEAIQKAINSGKKDYTFNIADPDGLLLPQDYNKPSQ